MKLNILFTFLFLGVVRSASLFSALEECFAEPPTMNFPNVRSELVQFAEYCSLAYCMPVNALKDGNMTTACSISSCTDSTDNQQVIYQFDSDVSGLIVQDNTTQRIVLIFKGTTTLEEWAIDFATTHSKYVPYTVSEGINTVDFTCKNCKVHTGFYDATSVFMKDAFKKMVELHEKFPDFEIDVTGHSLGASLAVLAANELRLVGMDVTLINFGSPKVGDPNFASWMDDWYDTTSLTSFLKSGSGDELPTNTYTRVTHYGDIVPLVPFAVMDFSHCGSEVRISEDESTLQARGSWSLCTELQDWDSVSTSALEDISDGNWLAALDTEEIIDHHLDYFMNVAQCMISTLLSDLGISS